MLFDPVVDRSRSFDSDMVKFYLRDNYVPNQVYGNIAISEVSTAIHASLVGLHSEFKSSISRALHWLERSIDDNESFGFNQNQYRARLQWAKAVARWLKDGAIEEAIWDAACIEQEASWTFAKGPWSKSEIMRSGVEDYLAFACQGENPEAGVEMYERWFKGGRLSLSKIIQPKQLGYAICLKRVGRQGFDDEALHEAGKRVLRDNLQEKWFGGGQFIRGTTWLKIVYEFSPDKISPLETILRAYENMPLVSRPNFV